MTGESPGAADGLPALIARMLDRPVPPEIAALARQVAARPGVAAVLFYGNMLRDPAAGGLADLYALTDSDRAWHGAGPGAVANRLLPPNVYHVRLDPDPSHATSRPVSGRRERPAATVEDAEFEQDKDGSVADAPARPEDRDGTRDLPVRPRHGGGAAAAGPVADGAKLAVMRLAAFRHRMRRDSWDTTLWARFAQPAALLYARDEAARAAVVDALATAWRTAAHWADRLSDGPERWAGLFAATYAAELRPEGAGRPSTIGEAAPGLYAEIDRLLPREQVSEAQRRAARRAWRRRCRTGRALNAARLVKAAATFRGGAAYALSKIERHAGPKALSPWEKRLPWLAAPVVLLRLLWRGGLR